MNKYRVELTMSNGNTIIFRWEGNDSSELKSHLWNCIESGLAFEVDDKRSVNARFISSVNIRGVTE